MATNHRLQQLCGAVSAKAVEDCMFVMPGWVSLNVVGGERARNPGMGAAERTIAGPPPVLGLAGAVHGGCHPRRKRGEDVRARIGVLSQDAVAVARFRPRQAIAPA